MNEKHSLVFGSTDLERRDRAVGAALTVVGVIAMLNVSDAKGMVDTVTTNSFVPIFRYQLYFVLSFLVVIGPCLMLPYRAGIMPLAVACLFTYVQVDAEFNASAQQKNLARSVQTTMPGDSTPQYRTPTLGG